MTTTSPAADQRDVEETQLIDDFSDAQLASNGNRWQLFSDAVMGGVSSGQMRYEKIQDCQALRLRGDVSLENNGGFIQVGLDLCASGALIDASNATGIAVTLSGDNGRYMINLRTDDTQRPWQSYRYPIKTVPREWHVRLLPFSRFIAHRIDQPLALNKLRRIGLIATGTAGPVDIAMARIALYRDTTGVPKA